MPQYSKEQAKAQIAELVKDFASKIDIIKRTDQYKEAQIEDEFIKPLFKYLNWNVSNEGIANPLDREFIVQPKGRDGKEPDYLLSLDRKPLFYMEAKHSKYWLHRETKYIWQAYQYAYSTQSLPVSRRVNFALLTDFEEFRFFDCTFPVKNQGTLNNYVAFDIVYTDYVEKFDLLWDTFEREHVRAGSLNSLYLSERKVSANRIPPDRAFLRDLDDPRVGWRILLAKDIKRNHPDLSAEFITQSVQLILDRFIFLKVLQDRELEDDKISQLYSRFKSLKESAEDQVYNVCKDVFAQLDSTYNGSVFAQRSELDAVTVSNRILVHILRDFLPDHSRYNFKVIPVEILGTIYEQFLGKVVITTDKRARIEYKPEMRKKGGVYYTPPYVVDYIVQHSLKPLLAKCSSMSDLMNLRICDPSCGSGSFLIAAYDALLAWAIAFYASRKLTREEQKLVHRDARGVVRLGSKLKREILRSCIFGVDIDPQAVEVTKLSLSLKALEDTNHAEVYDERTLWHTTILPHLDSNIKCGNSIVSTDYEAQARLLKDGSAAFINSFDWRSEFKAIMHDGGFHAIIGNPPYGMATGDVLKKYLKATYSCLEGRYDLFEVFVERAYQLLRSEGQFGYIIPSPVLTNLYSRKLRLFLLEHTTITQITNFTMDVFEDPTVHSCIILFTKRAPKKTDSVSIRKSVQLAAALEGPFDFTTLQSELGNNETSSFDVFIDPESQAILRQIAQGSTTLGNLCFIRQCIKTGDDTQYVRSFEREPRAPWKLTLRGKSIDRFRILERNLCLKYGDWLARNWKNRTFYETPKIAVRETGSRIIATLDLESRYFLSSLYAVYFKTANSEDHLLFLLGILNSKLATFVIRKIAYELTKGAFTKVRTNQLARLPIPADFARRPQFPRIRAAVREVLQLAEQEIAATLNTEKTALQRRIEALERTIDSEVFAFYGIGPTEASYIDATV